MNDQLHFDMYSDIVTREQGKYIRKRCPTRFYIHFCDTSWVVNKDGRILFLPSMYIIIYDSHLYLLRNKKM